tara:strand:- start:887 stop:1834 length:948 start_codon:yes stop_codon:yes gene_type:complete
MEFPLIEEFKMGKDQLGYVTVDGGYQPGFPTRNIRIKCDEGAFDIIDEADKAAKRDETDEEIIERLRGRFDILEDMTQAVKEGTVRAMIVTGPPGVGKSFGVDKVLHKEDLFNMMGERKAKYEVVKGAMSAIGLYCKLYEYADKGNVVVFDDCDSVLLDDLSLNILKAALDSSTKRMIHWNTDSSKLRSEGVPGSFEFKAGAIFITNIKFENVRSKKLQDHLSALESRCHYVDLQMDTEREKVLRIKQITKDGMLDSYGFENGEEDEVIQFIDDQKAKLRELSLRTVLKIADLRKSFPTNWKNMAEVTVMKTGRA